MACTLAESPCDPFHRKLRQLRCLRCRFDCYRVERTSSRAGVAPTEVQRLSRRTVTPTMDSSRLPLGEYLHRGVQQLAFPASPVWFEEPFEDHLATGKDTVA